MAFEVYSNLDLKQNELQNFSIKRGTLPENPVQDQFAVDTDGKLKQFDGVQWVPVCADELIAGEAVAITDGAINVLYDNTSIGLDVAGKLSVIEKVTGYAATIGDGTTTSFTITHNLNTKDVIVQVIDIATGKDILVDTTRPTVNTVVVNFGSLAPSLNSFRVLIKSVL